MRRVFAAIILSGILLLAVTTVFAGPTKEEAAAPYLNMASDAAPNIGPVVVYPSTDDQWDMLFWFDAQLECGDDQLLGVEFAEGQFYVSGGGGTGGTRENTLWVFDSDGNVVDSVLQWTSAGWGWRDLAYDGTYIYGSEEDNTVDAINPVTLQSVPASNINVVGAPAFPRAIAYDPDTDHFWAGNFATNIYEFNRSGNVVWQGTCGLTAVYGMAWDNVDPDGPWLWIYDQTGTPQTSIHQFNPATHSMTGVSYNVPLLPGSSAQIAGGICFTDEYDPALWTLIGATQGTPDDDIFVLEMYTAAPPAAPAAPTDFTVEDNGAALTATLNWTTPTLTVNGAPLTDIDTLYVLRGVTVVMTYTTVGIGQPMTYNDNVPSAGMWEYSVYAVNDAGAGPPATASAWIGPDVPGSVTALHMTPGAGGALEATLTWTNPTAGAHGGYYPGIVGYHIGRSDAVNFELIGENTTYFDGTIPEAGDYFYRVTPYNAAGDGPTATSNTAHIGAPQIWVWAEIPHVWNDISTFGINTGLTGDDQNLGPFPLGFDFGFYGSNFSSIRVCSNGWASFTSTVTTYFETAIPNAAEPNNVLYGFWDDLYLPTGGRVYYYADATNHTFTIQWNQVPHISTGGPYTFQIVLNQDGTICYHYHIMNDPVNSCTVGIENSTGTDAVQVCFDGNGQFIPHNDSSIRFSLITLGYGWVSGNVTRDGLVGNITDVLVVDDLGDFTHPVANGDYMLGDVLSGTRQITAQLPSWFYPTTIPNVAVIANDTTTGVNITIRRLEPTVPTGLAGNIDPLNGHVTVTWDNHPDATVDSIAIQRKEGTGAWAALATVHVTPSTYLDILPHQGQWFYRLSALDYNVTPPASQSAWCDPVQVIWGELPPTSLSLNGTYDDRIRLRWHAPGGAGNPPLEIAYDDSIWEWHWHVSAPNGAHDYMAELFSIPPGSELLPPIEFPFATMLLFDSSGTEYIEQVMICSDVGGLPNVASPLASAVHVPGPPGYMGIGWGVAEFGDFALETADDFWVVVQFPPGNYQYPLLGEDQSAPDGRSWWYGDPYGWTHWLTGDWMIHAFLGAWERDDVIAQGPIQRFSSIGSDRPVTLSTGPVSVKGQAAARVAPTALRSIWSAGAPPSAGVQLNAPTSGVQLHSRASMGVQLNAPASGTDETDQVLLYYKIYRDGTYLDTSYANEYFDMPLVENIVHSYYVTGWYDNGQESGPTNTDTARCNMAPGAPTDFHGTPDSTQTSMILNWTDPTVNADGTPCVDLALLKVYRDGTFLGNVNPGVHTYTDTPPNPSMIYVWTVRAQDEVPNQGPAASYSGWCSSPWNEIPFMWVDIMGVGSNTGLTGDDQNLGPFNLGFDFTFYGNTYNSIRVCSNGWVSFTSTSIVYSETAIPNPAEPNNVIYLFWDDLYLPTGGQVYYYADAANGWFIVQYNQVPHISVGGPYTMQVILTNTNVIYMNYHTINDPNNSCTVGVENATGTMGIQVCYDGTGNFIPHSQSSISFWGGPPAHGSLEGYVREAEGDDPIEGALVRCGVDSAVTSATGFYQLANLWAGDRAVTASKFGYISETDTVEIVEDSTTTQDFYLHQPIISWDVSSINVAIPRSTPHDETFNISNVGDGTLTFDIRLVGAGMDEVDGAVRSRSTGGESHSRSLAGPIRRNLPGVDDVDDPWVTVDPRNGSVEPGESQLITLSFLMPDSAQIGDEYNADCWIRNNTIVPDVHIPIVVTIVASVPEADQTLPLEYALYQNYPNPFNPMTRIRFDLRETSHVVLEVFDILGRKVVTVVDNTMGAGRYTAEFNATRLASGLYFYRISANDFSDLKKMVLIK